MKYYNYIKNYFWISNFLIIYNYTKKIKNPPDFFKILKKIKIFYCFCQTLKKIFFSSSLLDFLYYFYLLLYYKSNKLDLPAGCLCML